MSESISVHIAKVYSTLAYGILLTAIGTTFKGVPFLPTFFVGIWFIISIAITDNNTWKLVYFSLYSLCEGVLMADAVSIVSLNVLITTMSTWFIMFSTISLCAFFTKDNVDVMMVTGILGTVLNVLLFLSIANIYFQSETLLIYDVIVGLSTFSVYLLVDTVKMVYEHEKGNNDFVWHAMELHLDVLNIFIRLLILIAENSEKDKNKKED